MASSKLKSRDPDHTLSSSTTTARSRRASSATPLPSSTSTNTPLIPLQFTDPSTMTVDNLLYGTSSAESTLLDAQITLIDPPETARRTVDEVWREIVAGRREMKAEEDVAAGEEEMMTLEDFLVKAGAAEEAGEVKMEVLPVAAEKLSGYGFDSVVSNGSNAFSVLDKMEGSIVGYGSNGVMESVVSGGAGRGKRGRAASLMEPLDKAAAQRQRRMIKNRESAARSRERKQAYQIELESLATRLEEENERLLKEKEERTKERFKQLMEKVIPVVEKRRPPRLLRRVRSFEW